MSEMKGLLQKVFDLLGSKHSEELKQVENEIKQERQKPLTSAIFGQTGVGKSSLTNAIFGTKFAVNGIHPCTKEPQRHDSFDEAGNSITFWDLPGIGESSQADLQYLDMYADIAANCDVIIWAFQADTRSIATDVAALHNIVERLSEADRLSFINRISVVVTKADTITPDPWIIGKNDDTAIIAAGQISQKVLSDKSNYFYDGLFSKYFDQMTTYTFITKKNINSKSIPSVFSIDECGSLIYYKGKMFEELAAKLIEQHPDWEVEINQIKSKSSGVACSARLNFNLNAVKVIIAGKTSGNSILRLGNIVQAQDSTIPWGSIRRVGLPIIYDMKNEKNIFDATTI